MWCGVARSRLVASSRVVSQVVTGRSCLDVWLCCRIVSCCVVWRGVVSCCVVSCCVVSCGIVSCHDVSCPGFVFVRLCHCVSVCVCVPVSVGVGRLPVCLLASSVSA